MIKDLEARMTRCLTVFRTFFVQPDGSSVDLLKSPSVILERKKSFQSIPLKAPVQVFDVLGYTQNEVTIADADFKKLFTFADEEFEAKFTKDRRYGFSSTYFLEFSSSEKVLKIQRGYSSGPLLKGKNHPMDAAYSEGIIFKNIGGVTEVVYSSLSGGAPFKAFIVREWPNDRLEFPGKSEIMELYDKRHILRTFVGTVENTFQRKFSVNL